MILQKSVCGYWFGKKKLNFFGLLPNTRAEGWRTLYCSLMATYQRSWFMNLLPSCCDFFAEISFWSLVLKKKLNFFGPLPNTEDKSLENALLFLNGDIAEKVGCKCGPLLLWFCRNLSLVTGFGKEKKTKFLWPTSEHRGQEFGECSIVPKWRQIREVCLLMWSFLAVICRSQSLVFEEKKTKFLWPTSEHREQQFGECSIVPQRWHTREA